MKRYGRWILAAVALAVLSVLLLRSLDAARLADAFRRVDWVPVAGAVVLCLFACLGTTSLRLQALLRALPSSRPISSGRLFALYLTSSAAQQLLLGPAAEIIRSLHLSRRYGYTIEDVAAAHVIEKVVDAITLALVALALLGLSGLPDGMHRPLAVFLAVLGGCLAVVAVLARRAPSASNDHSAKSRVRRVLARILDSFSRFRSPRIWAVSIVWSCIAAAVNAATMGMVLWAVGQPRPVGAWLASLLAARLSGVVPTTPGQIGVQEGGVALVLGTYGVEPNQAIAAAFVYRIVHAVPVFLAGLLSLRSLTSQPAAPAQQRPDDVDAQPKLAHLSIRPEEHSGSVESTDTVGRQELSRATERSG